MEGVACTDAFCGKLLVLAVLLAMLASRQPEEGPHRPSLKKYHLQKLHNEQTSYTQSCCELNSHLEYSFTKNTNFCRHFWALVGMYPLDPTAAGIVEERVGVHL